MENKYYTPTIEEFHVGFEYEMKRSFGDGTVKSQEEFDSAEWEKEITTLSGDPYIHRALTGKNAENNRCGIRVKYLDREDIESLGWQSILMDSFKSFWYNSFYLDITENQGHKWDVSIFTMDEEHSQYHFLGTIKNKSELKKLMQQLNIK